MGIFGHYIHEEALCELENYKYTSGAFLTPLESQLNKFWEVCVTFLPRWLAPNAVTLCGFVFSCLPFVLVIFFAPNGTEVIPFPVNTIIALSYFLYQTLDAIDGKQARRTGSSSVLGTLFDHGCDIVTSTTMALAYLNGTQCGAGPVQFIAVVVSSQFCQFMYLWWEYYFHVFFCNPGFSAGVSEIQITIIVTFLMSDLIGVSLLGAPVLVYLPNSIRIPIEHFFGVTLRFRHIVMAYCILTNGFVVVTSVITGLKKIEKKRKKIVALLQYLGFTCFVIGEWGLYSSCLFRYSMPQVIIYLLMTICYSTVSIRLLLASTCKRRYWPFQWPLLPFFATSAFLYFGPKVSNQLAILIVLACLIWQTTYLLDFLLTSINDICIHLGIKCFTIVPKDPSKKIH